jgi:hypothetical protein
MPSDAFIWSARRAGTPGTGETHVVVLMTQRQPAAPCERERGLGYGEWWPDGGLSPAAWNGSWNGWPGNPLVLGAAAALSCGIGAGSAHEATGVLTGRRDRLGKDVRSGGLRWTGTPESSLNIGPRSRMAAVGSAALRFPCIQCPREECRGWQGRKTR